MNEWIVSAFKRLSLKSEGQTGTTGGWHAKINEEMGKYQQGDREEGRQRLMAMGSGGQVSVDGEVFRSLQQGWKNILQAKEPVREAGAE